jgi:hypothetical protein
MTDNDEQKRRQRQQRDQVVAKAVRNRDETRRKLLAQGHKLARRRAENVERGDDSGPTRPSLDSNAATAARHSHSTVPEQPTGSTVPAADRLYGLRLYRRLRDGSREESRQTAAESETPVTDTASVATDGGEES